MSESIRTVAGEMRNLFSSNQSQIGILFVHSITSRPVLKHKTMLLAMKIHDQLVRSNIHHVFHSGIDCKRFSLMPTPGASRNVL